VLARMRKMQRPVPADAHDAAVWCVVQAGEESAMFMRRPLCRTQKEAQPRLPMQPRCSKRCRAVIAGSVMYGRAACTRQAPTTPRVVTHVFLPVMNATRHNHITPGKTINRRACADARSGRCCRGAVIPQTNAPRDKRRTACIAHVCVVVVRHHRHGAQQCVSRR